MCQQLVYAVPLEVDVGDVGLPEVTPVLRFDVVVEAAVVAAAGVVVAVVVQVGLGMVADGEFSRRRRTLERGRWQEEPGGGRRHVRETPPAEL